MISLTPEFVTGYLRQAGSSDPTALESRRQELIQRQQPMRLGSLAFIVLGAILTISIIGAILGLPMLAISGWVHWKARTNLQTIDAAWRAMVPAGSAGPAGQQA